MFSFPYFLVTIISLYAGIWKIGICGIISACTAFDAGTLTGAMILWTIAKITIIGPMVTITVAFILAIIIEVIKGLKEKL